MAAALLVVVLTAVVTIMPWGGKSWLQNAAAAEAQQHARLAMEEMVNELKYAYRIEVGGERQRLTYYKKRSGSLRRYQIYVSGRQLLLGLPEGTAVPLAYHIETLFLAPNGQLQRGDVLSMTLEVSIASQTITLRSAVAAKNIAVVVP